MLIAVCWVFVDETAEWELIVTGVCDILMAVIGVTGEAMVVLVLAG